MRYNSWLRKLLYLAAFVVFASSCTSPGTNVKGPSQLATEVKGNMAPAEYVIAPQDVLQITVFQVPDLSKSVQVNGTGDITMSLIGQVHVGGKTIDEAQQEITAKLGKKYIQSPQVTVLVTKSGQRVTVNGAVKNPNVLTVDGRLTLSQAIAQAGGFSDLANSSRIHVARVTNDQVQDIVYDMDTIQSGTAVNPTLQGGDIVVVEESNGRVVLKNVKDLLPFAFIAALI